MSGEMGNGSLMERICAMPNLIAAWRRVRRNIACARRPHSCGVDAVSVAAFEQQWEANLEELRRSLLEGSYRPLPPKRVEMGKPGGGKRTIGVLAVRDRIAQRAAQQVLEPLFEPDFLDCSYGFRPGRSIEDAVHRVLCYRQAGCEWVFDADIAACFDSLDHRLLLHFVEERVQERAVLDLIQSWLETGILQVDGGASGTPGLWDRMMDRLFGLLERRLSALPLPAEGDGVDPELEEWGSNWERREMWRRVGSDLLLLGLAAIRPTIRRARPVVRWLARRKQVVLGTTGFAGLAALAGLWWVLRRWEPTSRGTLQGGALSPLLANIYLHHFDLPMVERGHRLVRYADDFVICCETREEAESAGREAARILADLRLRLNPEKTRLVTFSRGFRFLGHRFRGVKVSPPLRPRGGR